MTITAALAADLGILTAALDEPGADIAQSLNQLALNARAAVPTYLGLSVIVGDDDHPSLSVDLADGVLAGDIRASLRLTLSGVIESREMLAVALILYAGSPGTFVDLAADLAWLTGRPSSDFVLDEHLHVPAGSRTGMQLAAAVINQAIGILIGRGYTPQLADCHLDTLAANAGTDRHAAAARILATLIAKNADQDLDIS
jgi:hypothetical protein